MTDEGTPRYRLLTAGLCMATVAYVVLGLVVAGLT